jgi:hypothetical protein
MAKNKHTTKKTKQNKKLEKGESKSVASIQ